MRQKREDQKLPQPWTDDPILHGFRFTNIRREDDRVSRDLVAHMDWTNSDLSLRLFNSVVFRTFNGSVGFRALGGYHTTWCPKQALQKANQAVKDRGGKALFGNAYIMANSLMEGMPKHQFYIDNAFNHVWEHRKSLLHELQVNSTLQYATNRFAKVIGYAHFLGYEMALDMEMLGLITPTDKFTWANPGPGARRGLNFIFGRPRKYSQPVPKFLEEMQWLFNESVYFLEPHVKEPFDMRCIENGLCETSKYASVLETGRAKRKYHFG
jgi:hypothetical protein